MKKGTLPFVIGIILLILSFPPNFLNIREFFYNQLVHKQYEMDKVTVKGTNYFIEDSGNIGIESVGIVVFEGENPYRDVTNHQIQLEGAHLKRVGQEGIFEQTFNFNNQIIIMKDQFPLNKTSDPIHIFPETASFPIEITINNRSFQDTKPITFQPRDFEGGRYNYQLGLLLINNRSTKEESLLIIQRFGKWWSIEESQWKFIWVSKNGETKVETFNNTERKKVPYRTAFINEAMVTPTLLGYKRDAVMYYPTFFHPLLYPWLTTLLGLLLTIFGFIRRFLYSKSLKSID